MRVGFFAVEPQWIFAPSSRRTASGFSAPNFPVASASVLPVTVSRSAILSTVVLAATLCSTTALRAADEELNLGVRTTDPRPPADQRSQFRLPAGFEIQLVASEPEINKPMNLAFDATGRLWVTTSIEYPWPAPADRTGRDRLMIFEDFGPDGKAGKVTEFASGLNIPIGVHPFRGGDGRWKAVVWSIPNIWLLEDTDGDGKADKRTALYGPFDHTRDTHGNQASFRRGFDGWLYATHGFNNDSHVTARDGSHVDLNSGNTYRIRLDGSRIEHHTHGQVNPFGLAWDARGNLYSSDCHSAPIYQLLEGGYYPSFGKPHDGLGFAPIMLEHAHGSTAIDGALYYEDDLWPVEYRDMFLIGNVMTSRLNRDRIEFVGSTPKAVEQPDFLTSTDPWFRPVDTTLGPDGALYVADFYNRIIGHYEVPLTHPGRDRERGRLWRIVHRKADGKPNLRPAALAQDLDGLVGELGSPNLPRRLMAMAEIEDRFRDAAAKPVRAALRRATGADSAAVLTRVHALWMLQRLGSLAAIELDAAAQDASPVVRVHAQRLANDVHYRASRRLVPNEDLVQASGRVAMAGIADADALVRRCAAEALGRSPSGDGVAAVLSALTKADPADTHLVYTLRKSLRDQLRDEAVFLSFVGSGKATPTELAAVSDVAISIPSAAASRYLLGQVERLTDKTSPTLSEALRHAARNAPESELPRLASVVRARFVGQGDFQLALFQSIEQGLQQRGLAMPDALKAWGGELATGLLADDASAGWGNVPMENAPTESPWDWQDRKTADGQVVRVLSSIARGEQKTGTLRSPAFVAGSGVSFWLCGHDGYPDKPVKKVNAVRLRSAETGEILFEAWPPRNDAVTRVTWDTAKVAGRRVVLEAADGDTGDAYAWLAIGGVEGAPALPPVSPRALGERIAGAAEMASRLGLKELAPHLRRLFATAGEPEARVAAGRGLIALAPSEGVAVVAPVLADPTQPAALRERLGAILAETAVPDARAAVVSALRGVPYRVQQAWAVALIASRDGAEAFLQALEQGLASPRLLQLTGARSRIERANPRDWAARMDSLTKGLPPADEAREKLIAARRSAQAGPGTDPVAGQKVFQTHCAPCHQVDGQGGLVGPQLTGIGNRGVERLCEDILDPNRNVDHAFRQTVLTLKDGETLSGLFRREEGALVVMANATGAEFTVPKAEVAQREESPLSLMPDNFGEAIPETEFRHLLAYLLGRR